MEITKKETGAFDIEKIKNILTEKYPIGYIPRQKLLEATGGILNPKTISNKDCEQDGINGAIKIGQKVCYPINEIIIFIQKNTIVLKAA